MALHSDTVFSIHDLRLSFPGEPPVFDGLEWDLEPGGAFAVMGPSGSGKTVFLKSLVGLVGAQAGTICYRGRDITRLAASARAQFRADIGMTFQKSGLFDSMTCGENLAFALRERLHLRRAQMAPRIARALEEVGLGGQENLLVNEMSGGMQKRLGIARALLLSPRVVLYDEPTAGLDPLTSRAINDLITQVRLRYEMAVVVVTSDPHQAYQLCSRLGFLYRGRFLAQGTTEAMRRSPVPEVKQFLNGIIRGPLTEGALTDAPEAPS